MTTQDTQIISPYPFATNV